MRTFIRPRSEPLATFAPDAAGIIRARTARLGGTATVVVSGIQVFVPATAELYSITRFIGPDQTTWDVPDDFVQIVSVEALGEGGDGEASSIVGTQYGGGGGGGGAYAAIASMTNIAAGDTLDVQVGTGGEGKATWLKNSAGTVAVKADHGRCAVGATGGSGGLTANSTGTTLYAGGNGGTGTATAGTRGGGGGGGAAAESGAGVAGSNSTATTTGAGAGGASGSGLAGAAALAAGNPGAMGATGSDWINETGRKLGSGSGAAGANSQSPGGIGGRLGAGGSGAGKTASAYKKGGYGAPGGLFITYRATAEAPAPEDLPYHVILWAGQSNGAGRAPFVGDETAHPLVHQWVNYSGSGGIAGNIGYHTGLSASDYRTISNNPKFMHPEGGLTDQLSAAYDFARLYAESNNCRVLIVPACYGGTTLVAGSPRWGTSGDLYLGAIDAANRAITAAVADHADSVFVGTVWAQGETDITGSASGTTYQTSMGTLIDGFRSGITGASGSWFLIQGVIPERLVVSETYGYPIDFAQRRMAFLKAGTMYAASPRERNDIGDNLHLGTQGMKHMGRTRLSLALRKARTKPELVHDFEEDILTETRPIGTTDVGATVTPYVTSVDTTAMAGASRRYLTAAGTFGASAFMQVMLECFATTQANQVVEWTDCYNSTGGVQGVTLRAQTGACVVSGTSWGKQGYQLLINHSAGTWTLDRLDASARSVLASGSLAAVAGRHFRIAAIGTTISAAYSADGESWTSLGSATDATYSAGQAAVGQFNGSTAGQHGFDNVRVRAAV